MWVKRFLVVLAAVLVAVFARECFTLLLVVMAKEAFSWAMLVGGAAVLIWLRLDYLDNEVRDEAPTVVSPSPPLPRQRSKEGVK